MENLMQKIENLKYLLSMYACLILSNVTIENHYVSIFWLACAVYYLSMGTYKLFKFSNKK